MKFALGKKAKFISDRSGFAFPFREKVKEWNGSIVHRSEYEEKHPQLTPRKPPFEPQALFNSRIDRSEVAIERLLNITLLLQAQQVLLLLLLKKLIMEGLLQIL